MRFSLSLLITRALVFVNSKDIYFKVNLIELKHVIILHTRQAEFTGVVKDVKEPTFTYDGEDQNQEEVLPYVRARILKC